MGRGLHRRNQAGFIYLLLLASIVILGVATATAAPLWRTITQRDREEELLFRPGEFRRAIARFRADHNRFPRDLKELLDDRTTLQPRRYLRRIYVDPMTGKADWKLELVADRTGVSSGIKDVHSASEKTPLKKFKGRKDCYCDW